MKKYKFFTIVELLVVIGILAMLFSLLSPSLKSVMSNSQRLACSDHLRVIGSGYHLYAEDADDDVADCIFIGSTSHKPIYTNVTEGDYSARVYRGTFHNGKAGYLEPYLGAESSRLTCPGSEYQQGLHDFGSSHWVMGVATYTSFSPFNFMVRKRSNDYIINPSTDRDKGWDKKSIRPVYLDPVIEMKNWKINDGRWDQSGAVIHGNEGLIPILMSDGHVMNYDRTTYPISYISEWGYTNSTTMINQIYEQL